jgi:hypothetical protein
MRHLPATDPSQVSRWLSTGVKHGIVDGGAVDLRIRRALELAIGALERTAKNKGANGTFVSHDDGSDSHVRRVLPN